MINNKLLYIVVYTICFILIWNFLDLLVSILITHNGYQFSVSSDLIAPLTMMIVILFVSVKSIKKKK